MAFRYSPKIVTDGLVLATDPANHKSYIGSGTNLNSTIGDEVGVLTNAPSFNTTEAGGTITLDGNDDHVTFGNASVANFDHDDSFTISGWFNTTQADGSGPYVGKWGTNGASTGGYQLWVGGATGGSRIAFSVANGGSTAATTTVMTYTFGIWNFFVGVYHANTKLECYLNNTGYQTTSYTSTINNPAVNFTIGKAGYGSQTFTGKSSSVLLYNRALTSTEVLQNYNATKSRFI